MLGVTSSRLSRLSALLCLPYLLLSVGSPFLHTCADCGSSSGQGSRSELRGVADPLSSEQSRVSTATAPLAADHQVCGACLWAKGAVGTLEFHAARHSLSAALPLILGPIPAPRLGAQHFVPARAPPSV